MRFAALMLSLALALGACAPAAPVLGPDGKPLPRAYKIGASDTGRIQFRMLDSVNALRRAAGVPEVALDAQLTASAATHSRDMSVQNRPWHFGSDGSSPLERAARTGFTGRFIGEAISETYETELETLAAWMESPDTRRVIIDPAATKMGFSWYQEPNGKIWWTLNFGT